MDREEIKDILDLVVRPAFSVQNGIIQQVNQAAAQRQIPEGAEIAELICNGVQEYTAFQSGCLYLSLTISGENCGASVSCIRDSHIFILEDEADCAELRTMALVSKELRRPLATVLATVDRLFPMVQDVDNQQQIAQINRGLFQMLRVINNMSSAEHYRSACTTMEVQDVCSVLEEIFSRAGDLIQATGTTLSFTNLNTPVYSLIDGDKLERAVYNILSNSLKFTPKGGFIHAELKKAGNKLILSVQDSGSGIPSGLLRSIYSRFQREPAVEDVRFGLGLGMVLIRSAAAVHGGTVLIDQPEGEGTRISMTIQIRLSDNTTVHSPIMRIDYAGEQDHGLIELADSLPAALYAPGPVN